jgi:hypothetical protein
LCQWATYAPQQTVSLLNQANSALLHARILLSSIGVHHSDGSQRGFDPNFTKLYLRYTAGKQSAVTLSLM